MVVLDATIVNVALPHIQTALGFSGTNLEWVVNAYALAFGGLLLLGGRSGDLLGRRRVFVAGILLFSLLCFGTYNAFGGKGASPPVDSMLARHAPSNANRKQLQEDPKDSHHSTTIGQALLGAPYGPVYAEAFGKQPVGTHYLLPFEIVSVHLLVVLIGAAYLARAKRRKGASA